MATDIIARGMITEYKSGTNIDFKENEDGSVTISASGDVSSEDTVARDTIDNHKLDKNNPHNVTAEQVGLGNVNNTADLDKPISTAVQTALDDKANTKHTHKKSDITDFPNSLPANGGDADTVNGFGVAEYVTTLPEGEYYTEAARINTRDKKIESCDTSNLKVGLADYATNADYAINSNTVNNHTVDSDVPANAVFTDTTNSDVTIVGNPIIMDNLQGGVPFSEMVVSGKNLLTYPFNETTKTVNGITFTDNGDGTITANGTATANATITLARNFGFENEGNYFLSGCPSGGGLNSFFINWYQNHTGVTQKNYNDYGSGIIIPYQHIFSENNSLAIAIIAGTTVNNLVFRPQLELGSTPTEYEPPITGRELQVNVCGKNLINNIQVTGTVVGVTVTKNDDGTVTINGTTTGELWLLFDDKCHVVKDKTYTFSMGFDASVGITFGVRSGDNAQSYLSTGTSGSFVAPETGICRIRGYAKSGITFDNLTIYPQLELGSAVTEYEPYHGSTTTITPDSNPYVIPNDIRQQDGLNVVSVSEGELSVVGVQKNAAIKRIWDDMSMDLLFDGVTSANNPAVIDLANYNMIRIDVGGNFEGTSYFNCGSTYFLKSTLDYAVTSYGCVAMAMSNQAVVINISKSGADYSLSFSGFNEKQLVDVIKIYGIK